VSIHRSWREELRSLVAAFVRISDQLEMQRADRESAKAALKIEPKPCPECQWRHPVILYQLGPVHAPTGALCQCPFDKTRYTSTADGTQRVDEERKPKSDEPERRKVGPPAPSEDMIF
jgi:hypothetical protein